MFSVLIIICNAIWYYAKHLANCSAISVMHQRLLLLLRPLLLSSANALCHNTTYEMRQQHERRQQRRMVLGMRVDERGDAAFWRKMQRLQIMWIMRSAGACVCINFTAANIADSMTFTLGIGNSCTRRERECGVCHISCLTNCIRVFNMRPTGALMLMCKGSEGLFHVMRKFYSCRNASCGKRQRVCVCMYVYPVVS